MRGFKNLPFPTRPVARKPASISINTPSTGGTTLSGDRTDYPRQYEQKGRRIVKDSPLVIDDSDTSPEDDPMSDVRQNKKPPDTFWKKKTVPTVAKIPGHTIQKAAPKPETSSSELQNKIPSVKQEFPQRDSPFRDPVSVHPVKRPIHVSSAAEQIPEPTTPELFCNNEEMSTNKKRFVKQLLIEDEDDNDEPISSAKPTTLQYDEEEVEIDLDASLIEEVSSSQGKDDAKATFITPDLDEDSPDVPVDLPRTTGWDYDMATSELPAISLKPLFDPGTPPPPKVKPPKFLRDGLAARLSKIAAREQADRGFWKHNRSLSVLPSTGSTSSTQASSLTVKVLSVDHSECSLTCVRGAVLQKRNNYLPSGSSLASGSLATATTEQEVQVFLPAAEAQQSDVYPEVTIKILPPWRELTSPDGAGVFILCPYYFLVINKGGRPSTSNSLRI